MLGVLSSAQAPVQALRLGYGVAMVGLALLLLREAGPAKANVADETAGTPRLAGVAECGAAPGAGFTQGVDTAHPHARWDGTASGGRRRDHLRLLRARPARSAAPVGDRRPSSPG